MFSLTCSFAITTIPEDNRVLRFLLFRNSGNLDQGLNALCGGPDIWLLPHPRNRRNIHTRRKCNTVLFCFLMKNNSMTIDDNHYLSPFPFGMLVYKNLQLRQQHLGSYELCNNYRKLSASQGRFWKWRNIGIGLVFVFHNNHTFPLQTHGSR